MAKNTSKKADVKWRGFVNITLNKNDVKGLKAYMKAQDDDLVPPLKSLLDNGHRLSLSWDKKSNCFMASMTCREPDNPNAGLCITSRSGDLTETIWMSLYKHFVLIGEDWSSYADDDDAPAWG